MSNRNDDLTPGQWVGVILLLGGTFVFLSLYAQSYDACKRSGGTPVKGALGWVECIEK